MRGGDDNIDECHPRWYVEQQHYVSSYDCIGHRLDERSGPRHNHDNVYIIHGLLCDNGSNGESTTRSDYGHYERMYRAVDDIVEHHARRHMDEQQRQCHGKPHYGRGNRRICGYIND